MTYVSLVTLGVDDLERATSFYEALGWRRSTASVAGTVAFFHGTPALALFGRADLAADARLPAPSGPVQPSSALAMNVADEGDVDRVVALAERHGAGVCASPHATAWGGYAAYFRDPDGHLWEVAHNPFFELGPDGRVTLPGRD
jgi:uncharacterized protein